VTRILVAGGGVAGVAAAVSASKRGADVVLA
jgi:NADPH-dependent 2,4-dienoyl-CoA reductase/sulfur reductase-like enzyme